MLPGLREYFEDSAARDISLVSFMKRFPDINEEDRINQNLAWSLELPSTAFVTAKSSIVRDTLQTYASRARENR